VEHFCLPQADRWHARLVRRLCLECRKPFAADAAQLRALGPARPMEPSIRRKVAPPAIARLSRPHGIYELLTVRRRLAPMIHDHAADTCCGRCKFPAACVHCAMTACAGRQGVIS